MRLLGLACAVLIALCLSGCGYDPLAAGRALSGDSGVFYTAQDEQAAVRAAAVFASYRAGSSNSATAIYNPSNRTQADSYKANLDAVVQELKGAGTLTASQRERLVQALTPFTNYLNLAVSQDQGGIVIPAGGAAQMNLDGYCLDQHFPAPGPGEQFRLVPISTIMPPELLPIYRAVIAHDLRKQPARRRAEIESDTEFAAALPASELLKLAQAVPYKNVPITQQDTQGTLWLLRNVAQNNLPTTFTNVNEAQLEYAYPGSLEIINKYVHNRNPFFGLTRQQSQQLLNSGLGGTGNTLASLFRAATPAPSTNIGYTEIQPGVVAHGYTTSTSLSPTIDIVNTTSVPAGFSPADWVAQAPRRVQRVALPLLPTAISYQGSAQTLSPVQRAGMLEVLGILGDVSAQFTPAAPVVDAMLAAAALQQLNSWMAANQNSTPNTNDTASRPPVGSKPIDETPWSGDHGEIKDQIGARGDDDTRISPAGDVWSRNPDGSWTNYGDVRDYTGSGNPRGKRGKDRQY